MCSSREQYAVLLPISTGAFQLALEAQMYLYHSTTLKMK